MAENARYFPPANIRQTRITLKLLRHWFAKKDPAASSTSSKNSLIYVGRFTNRFQAFEAAARRGPIRQGKIFGSASNTSKVTILGNAIHQVRSRTRFRHRCDSANGAARRQDERI